jgi:hypothetical protein
MFGPDMKMEDPDWGRQDIEFKIAEMATMSAINMVQPFTDEELLKVIEQGLVFPPLWNGGKTWPTYVDEVFESHERYFTVLCTRKGFQNGILSRDWRESSYLQI